MTTPTARLSTFKLTFARLAFTTALAGCLAGPTGNAGTPPPGKETKAMAYPNYEVCADSPELGDDTFGVIGRFPGGETRTTFGREGTWVLHGTYRVGSDILHEFGMDVDPHVLVIVMHKESRAVYSGRILKDDQPVRAVPEGAPIGGELSAITSYFNIDLKTQCRIRPQPGKYWAVILLGPLVSLTLEFDVK